MVKHSKIVKKASATETLKAMERKQSIIIAQREIREGAVRTAISRLNKKGYRFEGTVTALGMEVIRIK